MLHVIPATQVERRLTGKDHAAFRRLVRQQYHTPYTDAELYGWLERHHKGRTLVECSRLLFDVGWCDKEHGGV